MIYCQRTKQTNLRFARAARSALAVLAVACVLVGGGIVWISLPESGTSSSPLPPVEDVGIDPKFGDFVPAELSFRDEAGKTVQFAELLGEKPVILAPVYYQCPMLCNMTMDGLVRGLRGLSMDVGKDFTVITVSFDPREDDALAAAAKQTALKRYRRAGAAAGWHFLTGDTEPIRTLTDAIGFRYKFDEQSGQYAHAAGLFVLTPSGEISRFLGGVEFAPRDLQLALADASDGRLAKLADQVLLLCFHYDPAQGQYGLAILRLVRFAGILTVGLLATGIVIMSRRGSEVRESGNHREDSSEAVRG